MFKSLPMQRIELSLLKEDAPQAALLLANYGSFDPEISEITPEQFPELPGEAYRQAYTETRAHLDKILAHYEIVASEIVDAPMQPVSPQQLNEIGSWLKTVWNKCSEQQEHMHSLRDEYRHTAQLLRVLDQFMDISIDLTLLQKKSALLDVRIGTLSRTNIQRFEEALGLAGYIAIRFFTSEEQVHLIIAGASGQAPEIERVLQTAGWRTMEIPAEFHGRPDEVRQELSARLTQMTEQQAQENVLRRAEPAQEKLRERLIDATHILARAAPYAELAGLMRGRGSLATVSGWIPDNQLPRLKKMLGVSFGDRYVLHARDPRALASTFCNPASPLAATIRQLGVELRCATLRRNRSHYTVRHYVRADVRHDVRRCGSRRHHRARWRATAPPPRTICDTSHSRRHQFDHVRPALR